MTFYAFETNKGLVIVNLAQVSYITLNEKGVTVNMNDGNWFKCVEDIKDFVDNFEIRGM